MDRYTALKQAVLASAPASDCVIQGEDYSDRFSVNDLNVWLDHENEDYIDSDSKTGVLTKPTLIIFQTDDMAPFMVEDSLVVAELQLLVNMPGGRPVLDGYTQLCEYILDKEEPFLRNYGFVLRRLHITRPKGGESIDPNLKGRLLLRSLIAHLSYLD